MYPSLTKIRSFIAVAEHGSFRRASEEMLLSQPALSTHIRDLEAELGVVLLSRTTRSVRLTAAGAHFLISAKRLVSELRTVVMELKDQAMLQRGRVTVACLPSFASATLPAVLARFSRHYPGVHVEVLDEVVDIVHERVLSGQADVGIGPQPQKQDLEFFPMIEDHFRVVFPGNHAFAGRKSVKLAEVVQHPFLTIASHKNVRNVLDRALQQAGLVLEPKYIFRHHFTLGGMVEAGLGITVLPSIAMSILGHPGLMSARLVAPEISRAFGVLRRRNDTLSPAAAAFVDELWAVLQTAAPGRKSIVMARPAATMSAPPAQRVKSDARSRVTVR
jgi:LysR family carnitine catabolism transcriptional activator